MSPVCPTPGSTTDRATHFGHQARQRSGSFFGGHGLKAVQGRRTGAAARFFFYQMDSQPPWRPGHRTLMPIAHVRGY